MIEFGNILRAAGLTVVETPGWRTRGHDGTFVPVGGVWHHTAGNKDLGVVLNGRADLAGPLAQLYHGRDGTWTVVCAGVAWHAGGGSQSVLDNVRRGVAPTGDAAALSLIDDCGDGNHLLLGIESEGGVAGEDWPPAQIESLAIGSAAISRALGWDHNHWIHHREWTARKTDMSYRGDLRGHVAQLLHPAPSPTTSQEADVIVIRAIGRPAAVLTPNNDGRPLARYLSSTEWQALYRLNAAAPTSVLIETRPVAEHDALTGGPK